MSFLQHLRSGITGVKGFQSKLDVIGNNISNVNTMGFKKSRVRYFESYMDEQRAAIETAGALSSLDQVSNGFGQYSPYHQVQPTAGNYTQTNVPFDMAVVGDGYFVLQYEDRQVYTRDGNFELNKNLDMVQESTGAFVKGWSAVFDEKGDSVVDINQPMGTVSFNQVSSLPARPTSKLVYSSNLDSQSDSKYMYYDQNKVIMNDSNRNPHTYETVLTQTGPGTFKFSFTEESELKAEFEGVFDEEGNVMEWRMSGNTDGLDIVYTDEGYPKHVTWTHEVEQSNGNTAPEPVTLTLPDNTHQTTTRTSASFGIRHGKPGDTDFEKVEKRVFDANYVKGAQHRSLLEVFDSKGEPHSLTTSFENVSNNSNVWQYTVGLGANDPLIQAYLNNPDNKVENPTNPSKKDLTRANDYYFGETRKGIITFDEDGIVDPARSEVPRLRSGVADSVNTYVQHVTLPDAFGRSTNMELQISSGNDTYPYEFLLPQTHELVQKLARDPQYGVADPLNILPNELKALNDIIFEGSNKGEIKFDKDGSTDEEGSKINGLKTAFPDDLNMGGVKPSFLSEGQLFNHLQEKTSNAYLDIELDMKLTTGFAAPFTTEEVQDGYAAGVLEQTKISANGDGLLKGFYTNGEERDLGQIALAIFRNASGLKKNGFNIFTLSDNAGYDETSIGKPMSETHGLVKPGFLETSNVNLAEEFTEMILAQKMFSSNSKIITTADENIKTGLALKK
jgi:flagellar hook-basal body protein